MPNYQDPKPPPQAAMSPQVKPSDGKEGLKLKFSLSSLIRKKEQVEETPDDEENSSNEGHHDEEMDDDENDEENDDLNNDDEMDQDDDVDDNDHEKNSMDEEDTNSQSLDGEEEKGDEPEVVTRRTRSSSIDMAHTENHQDSTTVSKKKEEVENTQATRSTSVVSDKEYGFRSPPSATVPTASFLDSLPHDQHRMRPRHLPDVSGFRRLHKAEIKRDLNLVRKLMKSTRNDKREFEEDDLNEMEVEGVALSDGSQSEDEAVLANMPKLGRGQLDEEQLATILENPELPHIFSLPYTESPYICPDVEGKSTKNLLFSAPGVVDSISAFNPPRPPESVGPKKMHRLQRWENDPQAVDLDITKYRKTVERTRLELQKMEDERERIETCGDHFRVHFMNHLQCMRHEMELLNASYEALQSKCIKTADLFTLKTRSRGVTKSTHLMKEVLLELKNRGEKIGANNAISNVSASWCYPGIGGISVIPNTPLASGWLLPGDAVSSPYGEGIVDRVLEPSPLETNYSSKSDAATIIPPRVCVKLPFGSGYFPPNSLQILENTPSLFDDKTLATKWMTLLDTCFAAGSSTDFNAVDNYDATNPKSVKENGMDVEEVTDSDMNSSSQHSETHIDKLLPFGSSLLPSSTTRGAGIEKLTMDQMEKSIETMISKSSGILGRYNNPSIPDAYKKWEHEREELRTVEGKVKQLRNALYRQKRLRYLNDRSRATTDEKRNRFEALLSEMKSDLDSLKHRLREELMGIGIDQKHAQELLSNVYESEYGSKRKSSSAHLGDGKRSRVNEVY